MDTEPKKEKNKNKKLFIFFYIKKLKPAHPRLKVAVKMSGIFNSNDLQEMTSNHKFFKQEDERKVLEKYACDVLFKDIRDHSETHAANIRQKLKEEIRQGRTQMMIWKCRETTYYREPGSISDCRHRESNVNPEVTLEEIVSGSGWDYDVFVPDNGSYKASNTLRLTNCLLLLAHHFGPNFSCSMKRSRFETAELYHVYEVEVWLRWHPTARSGTVKEAVKKAIEAYNIRNPAPVENECYGCYQVVEGGQDYCSDRCEYRDRHHY